MLKKALYLRAEHERFTHKGIVHGLYAEKVPCTEKLFFLTVPDNKGKHSSELAKKLCAVLFIAVHQHLGVGICGKGMPRSYKLLTDLTVVVYLSVEHQHHASVLVEYGLIPGRGYVDYAQPAVPKGNVCVNVLPPCIRSTVPYPFHHFPDNCVRIFRLVGKSNYSTHLYHLINSHLCIFSSNLFLVPAPETSSGYLPVKQAEKHSVSNIARFGSKIPSTPHSSWSIPVMRPLPLKK